MAKKSLDDKYKKSPNPREQYALITGQKLPPRKCVTNQVDSESTEFRIVLPLPPRELSPNSRCHWRAKVKAKNSYKEAAISACVDAGLPKCGARSATERSTFYFKDSRRRDSDNFAASEKYCWDSLVDYGFLSDDDQLTHLPLIKAIDKENPRLEIVLTIDTAK